MSMLDRQETDPFLFDLSLEGDNQGEAGRRAHILSWNTLGHSRKNREFPAWRFGMSLVRMPSEQRPTCYMWGTLDEKVDCR